MWRLKMYCNLLLNNTLTWWFGGWSFLPGKVFPMYICVLYFVPFFYFHDCRIIICMLQCCWNSFRSINCNHFPLRFWLWEINYVFFCFYGIVVCTCICILEALQWAIVYRMCILILDDFQGCSHFPSLFNSWKIGYFMLGHCLINHNDDRENFFDQLWRY